MGGDDSAENLVILTVEEHAIAHKELYEIYGKREDYVAWKCLSGQMAVEDILLERSRLGAKKRSQKNIGRKNTEESKKKMSLAKLGKKRTEESKLKQSVSVTGDKNHFYGKTHTEETKKKMSLAKKRRYLGEGNPRAKNITYNNILYPTLKECSKQTGISLYHLRKIINS